MSYNLCILNKMLENKLKINETNLTKNISYLSKINKVGERKYQMKIQPKSLLTMTLN